MSYFCGQCTGFENRNGMFDCPFPKNLKEHASCQMFELYESESKKNTFQMTMDERLKECTALVLCKDELFFQTADGDTVATWYPVGKAAASVCSLHFGIPLSYEGGPDIDNEEMITKALSKDDYVG